MEVAFRLLALLAVLLAGTGLRTIGVLNATRTERLNAVAYYGALPALIFVATYDQAIGSLVSPALFAGVLLVLLSTAILAWLVHRNRTTDERRGVAIIQSYHTNLAYLGVPLVAATFDANVTAIAIVVLGIASLIQIPLTIVLLVALNGADTDLRYQLSRLATNPILLALVAGALVGSIAVPIPGTVVVGLDALAALALPLALLCVGASLEIDLPDVDPVATGAVTAVKVAAMPAIAWLVFSALAVDDDTFTAAVVMLAMPTAVSTYVFSSELGGDEQFASLNVFVTTVVGVATVLIVVMLLGGT
ncbi:AEC family transporter [Natrialbaceae archaeon A-CW1-1]